MFFIIGVDAHKATSQITVMDESGKVLKRQRVLSNPEGFRQGLGEFGHPGIARSGSQSFAQR